MVKNPLLLVLVFILLTSVTASRRPPLTARTLQGVAAGCESRPGGGSGWAKVVRGRFAVWYRPSVTGLASKANAISEALDGPIKNQLAFMGLPLLDGDALCGDGGTPSQ